MKARRSWWVMYAGCVAAVLLALAWVTVTALRLERAERTALGQAAHQESLRLALWRMDSWLAPQLARESARAFEEYQPFTPPARAYTKGLAEIEPGEVITPSPLLSFESEYLRLHFQLGPDGAFTSPQAPAGTWQELAEETYLPNQKLLDNRAVLVTVQRDLAPATLAACAPAGVNPTLPANEPPPVPWVEQAQSAGRRQQEAQRRRSSQELASRQRAYLNTQTLVQDDGVPITLETAAGGAAVGGLVPIWLPPATGASAPRLIFARQVRRADGDYYQGFLCDWPRLRAAMLAEIADLFSAADLLPVSPPVDDAQRGMMLATIPVRLEVPAAVPLATATFTPARSALALVWLAMIAAVAAIGVTLRASIDYGFKRSRFASAVTHELRTPLTTFRMYTEMLADGMVRDDQRQSYVATLKDESGRLSTLVENVLSYARLEEGRWSSHARDVEVIELLDRLVPRLQRRAEEAGMTLAVNARTTTTVHTDVEAVGQVLYNLVDNACKYARHAENRTIELGVTDGDGHVRLAVRDHGPGVAEDDVRRLFVAFERGSVESDQPGIGIGLALSAGLARDLGGRLAYGAAEGGGARFELMLPREGRTP